MQYLNKREKILDAMQQLMTTADTRSITVSEIAQKAGIGKGSIYYYFPSKNDILDGVIERAYSRVLEKGRALAAASDIDAFRKMEIIYHACLEASKELRRQESFNASPDDQERAFIHLKFAKAIITHLRPILADILRQAVAENGAVCEYPEETAYIILLVLTATLDNRLVPMKESDVSRILTAFTQMQGQGLNIPPEVLHFLIREV